MKRRSSANAGTRDFPAPTPPERESDVLRAALDIVRELLPATWTLEERRELLDRERRVDAALQIRAPNGARVDALVEAKRLLSTRDVPTALEQLRRVAGGRGDTEEVVYILVARYLAPATRERIAAAGAGYVDLTGNVYLVSDRPAILVRNRGSDRDPWRGPGRPRGTLQGAPAARVVRALIDFVPPYSVPEIAARAGTSTGATYRVIKFLEEQEFIDRESRGPITGVRCRW